MVLRKASQTRNPTRRATRSYAKALRDAGIAKDDLELLRELAEMNAKDLAHPDEDVPVSRVLL